MRTTKVPIVSFGSELSQSAQKWSFWLTRNTKFFRFARRQSAGPERVLATLLFIDIVESTPTAVRLGDRAWKQLLENYYCVVHRNVQALRGLEMGTAGDGVCCAFQIPTWAIQCAFAIKHDLQKLGLQVRSGLHAGECETLGRSLAGIAVHVGARILGLAQNDQILVSQTVKDLVEGSAFKFVDCPVTALRGIPGQRRLFLAQDDRLLVGPISGSPDDDLRAVNGGILIAGSSANDGIPNSIAPLNHDSSSDRDRCCAGERQLELSERRQHTERPATLSK